MNKKLLLAAPIALFLAACSHHHRDRGEPRIVNAVAPQVSVVDGKIRAPSVVVFSDGQTNFTITWQLFDSQFTFPENGIVIDGEVVFPSETVRDTKEPSGTSSLRVDTMQRSGFKCSRQEDGRKFSCASSQLVEGIYKYTVRVQGPGGSPALKVDPPIIIMKRF